MTGVKKESDFSQTEKFRTVEDVIAYVKSKPSERWTKDKFHEGVDSHCMLGWLSCDFRLNSTPTNKEKIYYHNVDFVEKLIKKKVLEIIDKFKHKNCESMTVFANDKLPLYWEMGIKDTWLKLLNEIKNDKC